MIEIQPRAGIEAEISNGNYTSFIVDDKYELLLIQEQRWGSEVIPLGLACETRITQIIHNLCAIRKHMRTKEIIP